MTTPTLRKTNDYEKFELCGINRDVKKTEKLEKSMRKHGYIEGQPIHVVKNGKVKLLIKDGHHRYYVARKLNIPFYYIISRDTATVHEINEPTIVWNNEDWMTSYVRDGRNEYVTVKQYHEKTGIALGLCVSLLAGESAASQNKLPQFKSGKYRLADDLSHAYRVAEIVECLKTNGVKIASNAKLVCAISKCLWVDRFEDEKFKKKIDKFSYLVEPQASLNDYVQLIEKIYNWKNQDKIPLAFMAEEISRNRQRNFGRSNN